VIWGAGIQASPAGRWLGAETDRGGRIRIDPDLSVSGMPNVYALGDTALAEDEDGKPLPALAQVAKQQGEYLGQALLRELAGGKAKPFHFHNRGNTAIVGRHAAVFDFGWLKLKGRLAWFLWALVHVYLLVGFDNRIRVTVQWLWLYLTYERGARLVMAEQPPARTDTAR
jgi:NADH:ubiquinone reductase (H+-translocating)